MATVQDLRDEAIAYWGGTNTQPGHDQNPKRREIWIILNKLGESFFEGRGLTEEVPFNIDKEVRLTSEQEVEIRRMLAEAG